MSLQKKVIIIEASGALLALFLVISSLVVSPPQQQLQPSRSPVTKVSAAAGVTDQNQVQQLRAELPYVPPPVIKAVYATSNTALSPERFNKLVDLIKTTELNAVVINVNDAKTNLLDDPRWHELAAMLNELGIHTIARIIVFQNEPLVALHPELALHTSRGQLWHDRGGHHWLDPASREVWDNMLKLSDQATRMGFRELNYDYIRFPSDGAVGTAVYPVYRSDRSKETVINDFAKFLHDHLKTTYPNLLLSADVFAHSILVDDDMNIGQRFTDIVDYFDVIAPMVYPSHYRAGNFGFTNPAAHPYEIVYGTLKVAKEKLTAAGKAVTVRPWLQDFNLGATYTAAMVKQQMKATGDAGFTNGWMLWNPYNRYTRGALSSQTEKAATH